MPPIRPAPPTATTTVRIAGAWSSISAAIVPWPATTAGWSYGCMSTAPVSNARSSHAA